MGERDLVRQVTNKPRAHCWDKEWRNGGENNPKAGTDETIRNSFLLEIQDVPKDLVPNAPRRWRRKKHLTTAPALPPVHGNLTVDKSGSSSDRMSSSLQSPQALTGIP